ncbi:MAG: 5-(carboxyamino)imidazole ribonucleotide synthase [Candidatus Caldatribacteriaceae bacterium]
MMTQEAKKMGFWVTVLDPDASSPAGQIADETITASFFDRKGLETLVARSDIVTYDIEHVDTAFLQEVSGREKIFPTPSLLAVVQDKWRQKEVLQNGGIPVPRFASCEDENTWLSFGFPLVRKARCGGYDGRGVFILRDLSSLAGETLDSAFFEEYIPVEKELAVLVARSKNGEVSFYPVVEMIFESEANICSLVLAPARITEDQAHEAQKIARACVDILQGVGIFAVEMFLARDGRILVNEIAPRPHNSGHFTIEACVTSQFEQHLRAICGLPLGSTDLLTPAVMVNLLGAEGYRGMPCIEGLEEALSIPGVSFHFYGKRETRPFRKMGHVTVLAPTLEEAMTKAVRVREVLKIKA